MSVKHRSPVYRIVGITFAFLVLGTALFVPILASSTPNMVLFWVILSIFIATYIATVVINEVFTRKRYPDYTKKKDE